MAGKLLNAALFQAAWFAAVLGAAGGWPWLGPLATVPVLGINLAMSDDRRGELLLWGGAGLLGLAFDSALMSAGLFAPVQTVPGWPFSPPWMIALWLNFAATLNVSLSWLQGRPLLSAAFGAIGGPLAYCGGAGLGATVSFPSEAAIAALAVGWGVVTPLLFRIAAAARS
ncbi:MAG: DUF2878 domain-containing protein [Deltaproteobacteria bacterium]|nr:MAG: DUF2878 domain-containing protein [Deltaproteobacteria bacterium]